KHTWKESSDYDETDKYQPEDFCGAAHWCSPRDAAGLISASIASTSSLTTMEISAENKAIPVTIGISLDNTAPNRDRPRPARATTSSTTPAPATAGATAHA